MKSKMINFNIIKHLNAELNPICHLLALFGANYILHVSRIGVYLVPNLTATQMWAILNVLWNSRTPK
jgi:hypothetical protein